MKINNSASDNLNKTFDGVDYSDMSSALHNRINLIKNRNSRNISMIEHVKRYLDYKTSAIDEMHSKNQTMIIEDRSTSHNGNYFCILAYH